MYYQVFGRGVLFLLPCHPNLFFSFFWSSLRVIYLFFCGRVIENNFGGVFTYGDETYRLELVIGIHMQSATMFFILYSPFFCFRDIGMKSNQSDAWIYLGDSPLLNGYFCEKHVWRA